MGSIIGAEFKKCGLKTDHVAIGGSRLGHTEMSRWPVLCRDCGDLASTNTAKTPLGCLTCGGVNVILYGGRSSRNEKRPSAQRILAATWRGT